jgi:hypothetical protein
MLNRDLIIRALAESCQLIPIPDHDHDFLPGDYVVESIPGYARGLVNLVAKQMGDKASDWADLRDREALVVALASKSDLLLHYDDGTMEFRQVHDALGRPTITIKGARASARHGGAITTQFDMAVDSTVLRDARGAGCQVVPLPKVLNHEFRPGDRIADKGIGKMNLGARSRPSTILAVESHLSMLVLEDCGAVTFRLGRLGKVAVEKITDTGSSSREVGRD